MKREEEKEDGNNKRKREEEQEDSNNNKRKREEEQEDSNNNKRKREEEQEDSNNKKRKREEEKEDGNNNKRKREEEKKDGNNNKRKREEEKKDGNQQLKSLLEQREITSSNVNDKDKNCNGMTLLHKIIVSNADVEQVQFLIAKGADVNVTDNKDRTPLFFAVRDGKEDVVEVLLQAGARLTDIPYLHIAVSEGSSGITQKLLDAGTDPDFVIDIVDQKNRGYIDFSETYFNFCTGGITSLHIACSNGYDSIVELLIDAADIRKASDLSLGIDSDHNIIDQPIYDGSTPLHLACANGNASTVKLLISAGANVNALLREPYASYTPLSLAIKNGNANDIVEILLKSEANPNLVDARGNTALFYAVNTKNVFAIKLLVPVTDIYIVNNVGIDIMQFAANQKAYDITKLLISEYLAYYNNFLKNDDPNIINKQGSEGATILHRAVQAGDIELIKMVVEAGANPYIEDNDRRDSEGEIVLGTTPIDLANHFAQDEKNSSQANIYWPIFQLLADYGSQYNANIVINSNVINTNYCGSSVVINMIGEETKDTGSDFT